MGPLNTSSTMNLAAMQASVQSAMHSPIMKRLDPYRRRIHLKLQREIYLARTASVWSWTVTLMALAATALIVVSLRGPCYQLPDSRLSPGHGTDGEDADSRLDGHRDDVFATSASSDWLRMVHGGPKTLSFEVCGGFADQRLSLIYGMIIAKRLARAVVLPSLIVDGVTKDSGRPVPRARGADPSDDPDPSDPSSGPSSSAGGEADARDFVTAPFEEVYDLQATLDALGRAGVQAMTEDEFKDMADDAIPVRFSLTYAAVIDQVERFFEGQGRARYVSLECPLYKLAPAIMLEEEKFIRSMLLAFRPSKNVMKHMATYTRRIGGAGPFNYLHLSIDKTWKKQCLSWDAFSSSDGAERTNCFNNTLSIDKVLDSRSFEKDLPLFTVANWHAADPKLAKAVRKAASDAGYNVVKSPSIKNLPREVEAMIEYELALKAERFLGNSVSTFSALAILQRRWEGQWAGYYNGGDVPLVMMMPIFDTPWVFTFNSWSPEYEEMAKVAVTSARKQKHIAAYCLFAGDETAPIAAWFKKHNVTVIHQDPDWQDEFSEALSKSPNPLFPTTDAALSTWQRIDIPNIPWLDQFTYVLYTDVDVYFRRTFSFHELPMPLPVTVGLGPQMTNNFPYSVGVMVLNLPALRDTYDQFLESIKAAKDRKFNFGPAGQGDQGAYNHFYERDVKEWHMPAKFNAKPYHAHAPRRLEDVVLVHFHGPKPYDYLRVSEPGSCDKYKDLCKRGLNARACGYARDWISHVDDRTQKKALLKQWYKVCEHERLEKEKAAKEKRAKAREERDRLAKDKAKKLRDKTASWESATAAADDEQQA